MELRYILFQDGISEGLHCAGLNFKILLGLGDGTSSTFILFWPVQFFGIYPLPIQTLMADIESNYNIFWSRNFNLVREM